MKGKKKNVSQILIKWLLCYASFLEELGAGDLLVQGNTLINFCVIVRKKSPGHSLCKRCLYTQKPREATTISHNMKTSGKMHHNTPLKN